MKEGSGSGAVPLTDGSGWPKNIRILRIRIRIRNTSYALCSTLLHLSQTAQLRGSQWRFPLFFVVVQFRFTIPFPPHHSRSIWLAIFSLLLFLSYVCCLSQLTWEGVKDLNDREVLWASYLTGSFQGFCRVWMGTLNLLTSYIILHIIHLGLMRSLWSQRRCALCSALCNNEIQPDIVSSESGLADKDSYLTAH
jgi:hypothetical protein